VYIRTRGRELLGNYNHILLSELFHEQSSRWATIASNHIARLFGITVEFVDTALDRIISEDNVRHEVRQLINSKLERSKDLANEELCKIVDDEKRQPITYNHYYTDNIQNARQESMRGAIQKAVKGAVEEDWNGKLHVSNTSFDSEKLLASLQKRVIVDMDVQACSEALAGLKAYYKVSMSKSLCA
jgi:hypothetical protein